MLARGGCTAGDLRSLLGTLESHRIATVLAALHYRGLQYLLQRPGRQGVFRPNMWLNLGKAAKEGSLTD